MFVRTRMGLVAAVTALGFTFLFGGAIQARDPGGTWKGWYAYANKPKQHHATTLRLDWDVRNEKLSGGSWRDDFEGAKDYNIIDPEEGRTTLRWHHDVDGRYYDITANYDEHVGAPDTIYFGYKVYVSVDGKPDRDQFLFEAAGELDRVEN